MGFGAATGDVGGRHGGHRPVLLPVLLAACAASLPALAADRPEWADRPPAHSPTTLFFTGYASGQDSEGKAREQAVQRAKGAIAEFFGVTVSSRTRSLEAERSGDYTSDVAVSIQVEGREVPLREVRALQWHHESRRGMHEAWVLVSYPRAEYDATLAALRKGDSERMSRAADVLREGRGRVRDGRCQEGRERLAAALDLLKGLNGLQPTGDGEFGTVQVLEGELRAVLAEADRCLSQSWKTVAVKVLLRHDGLVPAGEALATDLQAAATARVAARGLAAASAPPADADAAAILDGDAAAAARAGSGSRADWLLLVLLDARFTSETYGQFFAEAGGRVELVEAATGRKAFATDLGREKGGHVTRRDALNKAAQRLRDRAQAAVEEALARVPLQARAGR